MSLYLDMDQFHNFPCGSSRGYTQLYKTLTHLDIGHIRAVWMAMSEKFIKLLLLIPDDRLLCYLAQDAQNR